MRFYYYTDGGFNVYVDDWKNKRYINLRNSEPSDMPVSMRINNPTAYYGDADKGHVIPDLCVILMTGKDYI